jgi:hypothetical protein
MTSASGPRRTARSRAPATVGAAATRELAAPKTPLEELQRDGRLGPHGAHLLYHVLRVVVVAHGFPPPGGRRAWDADAVAEVAHDFVADERTPKRLAHLVVHAVDDVAFDRILHRMVLNFMRDAGRRTETGRLMLRLRDVLGRSDEFVAETGDRFRLASQPSTPSTTPPAMLVTAAAVEPEVNVPRWSAQTRRRPPAADEASLQRLCRRVLQAAAGTVPLDQLARAIAPRLGLALTPLAEVVDDRDVFDRVAAPHHTEAVLDSMQASDIFGSLSDRERLLLAHAGTPVRQLGAVLGLGPSQAAEVQVRLRAVLAAELEDDENYEAVFFHLVDQAKAWATSRTTGQSRPVARLVNAT